MFCNMFALSLLFSLYFVQFSSCFYGSNGLIGLVFGFQKICFCRCGLAQKNMLDPVRSARLLGGESATPHQFPWLAIINIGSKTFGGSLISDRHVLTAATPLYGIPASSVTVTLGAHDRCSSGGDPSLNNSVASVLLHPIYSPTNMNYDVALLRLRHVVPFSQFVAPICMPLYGSEEPNRVAWTVSWADDATLTTCTPRVATLPILDSRACIRSSLDKELVTYDKGCLGPVGIKSVVCKVDVGAPVMTRWVSGGAFRLAGVMSPASSCDGTDPPLYTKVIDHAPWIYDNLRSDCQCF